MKQFIGTVFILLVAVVLSVAANLYLAKDYQAKIHNLEQQGKLAERDMESVRDTIGNLKENLEALNTQFKSYSDGATNTEGRLKIDQEKIEAISSKIEEINKNIQSLQKSYNTTLSEMQQQTQAPQSSTTIVKVEDIKKVDLGEIAVKKSGQQ